MVVSSIDAVATRLEEVYHVLETKRYASRVR
jgi:hypothetical protein